MRKIMVMALPYAILCLLAFILGIIWLPHLGGWVQVTNSWIGLFFVCAFCAIFLFQEDIYHFLDQYLKNTFFGHTESLQKNRDIPDIFKNEDLFQELISGTVMAWMEKVNIQKEEQKMHQGDISQVLEHYKKLKKENIKWIFLFADCFLVQHSKDILSEIYERHYLTEQAFRERVAERVKDKTEAEIILEVLQYLRFIRRQEEEVIITETGSAYCTYLERVNQK